MAQKIQFTSLVSWSGLDTRKIRKYPRRSVVLSSLSSRVSMHAERAESSVFKAVEKYPFMEWIMMATRSNDAQGLDTLHDFMTQ